MEEAVATLNRFWEIMPVTTRCSALLIDEEYQSVKLEDHAWMLNVEETMSRVLLSAMVVDERTFEAALSTLKYATVKLLGYKGKPGLSDDWPAYANGYRAICMKPDFKSKKEDIAHINQVESLHSIMRSLTFHHMRTFASKEILQLYLDLFRHYYNWIRLHSALGGKAPMEAITGLKFRTFHELIRFAEAAIILGDDRPRPSEKPILYTRKKARALSLFRLEFDCGLLTSIANVRMTSNSDIFEFGQLRCPVHNTYEGFAVRDKKSRKPMLR